MVGEEYFFFSCALHIEEVVGTTNTIFVNTFSRADIVGNRVSVSFVDKHLNCISCNYKRREIEEFGWIAG